MPDKLIYILQIQFLFECKSNLTRKNQSANETRNIYRKMDNKKNPALCDDVIEQRDQAIRGRNDFDF